MQWIISFKERSKPLHIAQRAPTINLAFQNTKYTQTRRGVDSDLLSCSVVMEVGRTDLSVLLCGPWSSLKCWGTSWGTGRICKKNQTKVIATGCSLCSVQTFFIKLYFKTSSPVNWDGGEVWRRAEREKRGGTERWVCGGVYCMDNEVQDEEMREIIEERETWRHKDTETQKDFELFLPTGSDCLLVQMSKCQDFFYCNRQWCLDDVIHLCWSSIFLFTNIYKFLFWIYLLLILFVTLWRQLWIVIGHCECQTCFINLTL